MTPLGALLAGLVLAQPAPAAGAPAHAQALQARAPSATLSGQEAARVVSGPPRLAPGTAIALGQPMGTSPAERLELLTSGRCLVRLAPGSLFRLGPPAPGARCPTLHLSSGVASVLAERPPMKGTATASPATSATTSAATVAMMLSLPGGTITFHHGVGILRASAARQGLCLEHGLAALTGSPTAPATPGASPAAPTTPAAPAAPAAPVEAKAGQCLWITSGAPVTNRYAEKAVAQDHALCQAAPALRLPVVLPVPDLAKELSLLRERGMGGERGGAGVEGGGQSMCLETGGEGGAGDVGTGGSVDIVKPPPPTRLNLRVVIRR